MRNATYVQASNCRPGLARESGQATAELSLVLLILLMLIFGIVDLSRAVYAQNVVSTAAQEGARWASTHPIPNGEGAYPNCCSVDPEYCAEFRSATLRLVAGINPNDLTLSLTQPDSDHVQVEVTYTFRATVQFIGQALDGGTGNGIILHGRSRMQIG